MLSTQTVGCPIRLKLKKRKIGETVEKILTMCGHGQPDVASPVEMGKVSQLKAWTGSKTASAGIVTGSKVVA